MLCPAAGFDAPAGFASSGGLSPSDARRPADTTPACFSPTGRWWAPLAGSLLSPSISSASSKTSSKGCVATPILGGRETCDGLSGLGRASGLGRGANDEESPPMMTGRRGSPPPPTARSRGKRNWTASSTLAPAPPAAILHAAAAESLILLFAGFAGRPGKGWRGRRLHTRDVLIGVGRAAECFRLRFACGVSTLCAFSRSRRAAGVVVCHKARISSPVRGR